MFNEDNFNNPEKLVDEALRAEPKFSLPAGFAEFMAEKVAAKMAWKNFFREFLVYLSVLVGAALVWGGISFLYYGADWKEWLNFFTSNLGLVIGISVLIVFVLFSDRVLLPYFLFRKSAKSPLGNG